MRKIGTHPDKQIQALVDYLTAEGIAANVIENRQGSFEVWVVDEDKLDKAKAGFEEFLKNPNDPKYSKASKKAKLIRKQEAEKKERTARNVRTGRQSFERRTPVIFLIVGLCVFTAVVSGFSLDPSTTIVQWMLFNFTIAETPQQIAQLGAEGLSTGIYDSLTLTTASLRRGELWRIVTPAFLHVSISHLIMNLFVFVPFGRKMEANEGKWFTIGFILVAAGLSNLVQAILPVTLDGTGVFVNAVGGGAMAYSPFAGISGVCFGLVAYCWQRGQNAFVPEYKTSNSVMVFLIAFLAFGFLGLDQQILGMSLANWAHGIGMMVGLVAGSMPIGRTAKR